MNNKQETEVLVIGTGIAGLSYALSVAERFRVTIISKVQLAESNTLYAQGGIASVMTQPDNFIKHVQDTLNAGCYLNKQDVVKQIIGEAPEAIDSLLIWGVPFDKQEDGSFDLSKEGGHSEKRILHYKDITGRAIQDTLTEKIRHHPNITVLENHFAIDLITPHHLGQKVKKGQKDIICYGAYVMNLADASIRTINAKITMLSTGGSGNIYQTTTNPRIATGDGIAMTARAKGIIEHMEFIQFHPSSLYNQGERPSFLITEALRGFGGILRNHNGDDFMPRYDARGSLAPRDIVARAIDNEMKTTGVEFLYLDCRHLNPDQLIAHFPNIYEKCNTLSINITRDLIPVVPAAHYQCGGIRVDNNGESSIHNLYATGEVASTGLHGANRLASNSLLEAVVVAKRAAEKSKEILPQISYQRHIPDWNSEGTSEPRELIMITHNIKEVQQLMSHYVGIVRSNERLKRALDRLEIIFHETENLYNTSHLSRQLCELRNIIHVSYLIIKMASNRKESIGLHYSLDYPPKQ